MSAQRQLDSSRSSGLEQALGLRTIGFIQKVLRKTPLTVVELLSENNVRAYAEWLLTERKVASQTVVDRVRMIRPLTRHPLLKGQDFAWIGDLLEELPPADRNPSKARRQLAGVSFDEVYRAADKLLGQANEAVELKRKAILVRDALLLIVLLVLAWRQRNIREAGLAPSSKGGNIFKEQIPPLSGIALPRSVAAALRVNPHATAWQFAFDGNGTKAGRPIWAIFPRQLVPLLEWYIELRAALLRPGAQDPGTLFLNDHGGRLTASTLGHLVWGLTVKYVGKKVYPHGFRHLHARKWLEDGRRIEDLSNNLWHTDPSFTKKVYADLYDESYGTKGVEEWLDDEGLEGLDTKNLLRRR